MASKNDTKTSQSPKPKKNSKKLEAKAPVEPSNRDRGLTIVGIGASAGGLEALRSFFTALPDDTGMAFVVVTHLHPEHESHMAELLQKHTRMPSMQVTERTAVEMNHVYVIPPNRAMIMTDTHLDTKEFEQPHGQRTPIDYFFRSMAASGHSDPVAIILSGTGTDGAVGVKDVKEAGGLIMVQQPEDAEYDGMPRAALGTGLVDVVLPAAQLAVKLADYNRHSPQLPHDAGQLSEAETETLRRILGQVYARSGHDFTQYKRSTVLRRVERRMQLNGFGDLDTYLAFLRANPDESQAMFNDILIGVTNFFRDKEAWDALSEQVIPAIIRQNRSGEGEGVRIWSIGCATGEEAYGLAILCFEEAEKQSVHPHIQIFASDLDERSIARAREGLYPSAIQADVSTERLERFFTREGEYYRVKREVRDVVLFAAHNVLRDPPFSRQHLIACRNVLIYLQRSVQDRIFDIFHYSLKPGGYLFLGTSESAEHMSDLFRVMDKQHRLYQANPWMGEKPHVPVMQFSLRRGTHRIENQVESHPQSAQLMEEPLLMERQHAKTLELYGPPSVIVNERNVVLHVSENAGRYLHLPKGPLTGDLLTLIRPELQMELRTALFHAFEKGMATVSRPVNIQLNNQRQRVILSVRPQPSDPSSNRPTKKRALVFFIEDEVNNPEDVTETVDADAERMHTERAQMVVQLQSEIQALREQLQITIEEYESANEEMKATNEELQSINEEYRSATEELETSKEELQSLNEELQTVNSEMRGKLEEIWSAHQELENLMGATEIATLYMDRELRIQRFTAGVRDLFSIMDVDRGRRISDLTHKLGYNEFVEDAEQVLRKLVPLEREVYTPEGNWFLIRLRPFHTREGRIEGVVATFIDINQLKQVEQQLESANDTLEERVLKRTQELDTTNQQLSQARDLFYSLFNANPIPAALTRVEDAVFINVNDEFLNYFNLERDKLIGHTDEEIGLGLGLGLGTTTREQFISLIREKGRVGTYETKINRPSGEVRTVLASVQYISIDQIDTLITAFIDITDRVKAEQQIHSLAYDLTKAEQEERRRISQVLHDDLQQRIFAVKLQVSLLYDAYRIGKLDSAPVDFAQLQEWLDEAVAITRNLSIDLSPAILRGDGLTDALVWLCAQMEEQYGLRVKIQTHDIAGRYDDTMRILLFQAVREVLFNIIKHANTLEAKLTIERIEGHTRITIQDEGMGFDAAAILDGSRNSGGLANLRHRLNLMACNLQIKSRPNIKGTQVIIDIPSDK